MKCYIMFRKLNQTERGEQKMVYDYSKLQGKIKEKFVKQENFARAIGISRTSLNLKLNGKSMFSHEEMARSIDVLDIPREDLPEYFFTQKV